MQAKIGSNFLGKVKDLASDGRGVISHPSGKTFFVPGVWLGEEGEFKVIGLKGRIGFAELVELSVVSKQRVNSVECEYHGHSVKSCGGCPWMFMDYKAQLSAKQKRIEQTFSRLNIITNILPIIPSEQIYSYRNRAQLKTNGKQLGFVAAKSNKIIDVKQCRILSEVNNKTIYELRQTLPNSIWQPSKRNQWTTIDIDETVKLNNVAINQRLPFIQANTCQNNIMKKWLLNKLDLCDRKEKIVELFCGSGNFTMAIANMGFENIVAAEVVDSAVAHLNKALISNDFNNVDAFVVDLFDEKAFKKFVGEHKDAEILVLDPPRDGLKCNTGLFSKKNKLRRVFYISCDLATLFRDVQLFVEQGFKVTEIQPLDMFPHTPHIESMVALEVS